MVPISHVLSGFLVGRFLRAGQPNAKATDRFWRDPVMLVAVFASVAPDFDVIPGLLGVWPGHEFHRSFTHSAIGSFILAACIGGIAHVIFRRRESFKSLYVAALLGVWTHIGWDILNNWGVKFFWPATEPTQGQLVHTGDFFVMGSLAVCAILSVKVGIRPAVVATLAMFPIYLGASLIWKQQIVDAVVADKGVETRVFPTRTPSCRWLVISSQDESLHADCARTPFSIKLDRVATVLPVNDAFVQASLKADMASAFREAVWFPFANVQHLDSGEVLVVWRDLREAFMDEDVNSSPGIHVKLNADGDVVDAVHKWKLPFY